MNTENMKDRVADTKPSNQTECATKGVFLVVSETPFLTHVMSLENA